MVFHLPTLSELRNTEFEIFKFQTRVVILQGVVLVCFALLGIRLFYLQVIRHEDLLEQAENNRTAVIPTVPNRGTILDRNGVVLANNYSAYTLEITPARVKDLDATIDSLSEIMEISLRDKRRFKRMREESKNFDSLPIRSRLTEEEVAIFTAHQLNFQALKSKPGCFEITPMAI